MTTKTDTYNYAQSPLSGNYTTVTAAGLRSTTSGANASSSSVQDNCTMWATSNYAFAANHNSLITVSAFGNNDWPGIGVRLSTTGGGQGYILYVRPEITACALYKLTAGTTGSASSYIGFWNGLTLAASDTFKLDATGTTLTAYHNGVSLGTVTDATYSTGQPGIAYSWANSRASLISNWTGTDSSGSSNTPPAWVIQPSGAALGVGALSWIIGRRNKLSGVRRSWRQDQKSRLFLPEWKKRV